MSGDSGGGTLFPSSTVSYHIIMSDIEDATGYLVGGSSNGGGVDSSGS